MVCRFEFQLNNEANLGQDVLPRRGLLTGNVRMCRLVQISIS
jgi:hypothetical protein